MQIGPGGRMAGIPFQGLLESLPGRGQGALLPVDDPQVIVSLRQVGIQPDGLLVSGDRFREVPLPGEENS